VQPAAPTASAVTKTPTLASRRAVDTRPRKLSSRGTRVNAWYTPPT
jgi:hypothetical protein